MPRLPADCAEIQGQPEPSNVPPTGEVVKDLTGEPAKLVVRT